MADFLDSTSILNSSEPENLTKSISHSKYNKIVLDNIQTYYEFEGEIIFGFSILKKYEHILKRELIPYKIDKSMYYKPEYVSFQLYNTTDLWYALLFVNDMVSATDFDRPEILVFSPLFVETLNKIINNERRMIDSQKKPIKVKKHYLKGLNEPSKKVLPNDFDKKINPEDLPFVFEPDDAIYNKDNYTNDNTFFLKGKMKVTTTTYDDNGKENGKSDDMIHTIRIHQDCTTGLPDKSNSMSRNFKKEFEGLMFFPKQGEYEMKPMINGKGKLYLDDKLFKEFQTPYHLHYTLDFFEEKSLNSDFKRRNFTGWELLDKRGEIINDDEIGKSVFHIKLENEAKDTPFLQAVIDGKDIPKGNDVVLTVRFKTTSNSGDMAVHGLLFDAGYVDVTYEDGTTQRLGHNPWFNDFFKSNTYASHNLMIPNLEGKAIKTVKVTFIARRYTSPNVTINADIFIDEISLRSDTFETIKIPNSQAGTWRKFKFIYEKNAKDDLYGSYLSVHWKEPGGTTLIPMDSNVFGFIPESMRNYSFMCINKFFDIDRKNLISSFVSISLNDSYPDSQPNIFLPDNLSYVVEKETYMRLLKGRKFRITGNKKDEIKVYKDGVLWLEKPVGVDVSSEGIVDNQNSDIFAYIKLVGKHTYGNGTGSFGIQAFPDDHLNPVWGYNYAGNFNYRPEMFNTIWNIDKTKKQFKLDEMNIKSFNKFMGKDFAKLDIEYVLDFDLKLANPLTYGYTGVIFDSKSKNEYYMLVFRREDSANKLDPDTISIKTGLYKINPKYPQMKLLSYGDFETFRLNAKLIQEMSFDVKPNTVYKMKVIKKRNVIRVIKDLNFLKPIIRFVDNDNPYMNGGIGFQSLYQSNIELNNVILWNPSKK